MKNYPFIYFIKTQLVRMLFRESENYKAIFLKGFLKIWINLF